MSNPAYLGGYQNIYAGSQSISEVYAGDKLVWPEDYIEWVEFEDFYGNLLLGTNAFYQVEDTGPTPTVYAYFEDSDTCGGTIVGAQDVRARASVLRDCEVKLSVSGSVEQATDDYDLMTILRVDAGYDLNGWWNGPGGISTDLEVWGSEDRNPPSGCDMGAAVKIYSWYDVNNEVWYPLDAGESIILWADTVDDLFHQNAYYQIDFTFRPR